MVRILLCDDHALFRQGLRSILELDEELCIVGEAATGQEAVQYAQKTQPDLVVMDIGMPVMDGLEATEAILAQEPHTKVIILTMYPQESYLFEAIRVGADAYLLKDAGVDQLIYTIKHLIKGKTLLGPERVALILQDFERAKKKHSLNPEAPIFEPTERDLAILRLLAQGASNQEIAVALSVSEKTVRNYLSDIYHKFALHNRTQAALFAIREGIAELEVKR